LNHNERINMTLRGIRFWPVSQASGVNNFYGQGYWFHRYLRPFGLQFSGSNFTTKTSTLFARPGNMPLESDGVTPRELFPKCIIVDHRRECALNAVSLSGPGLEFLLQSGEWQRFVNPFQISLMSLAPTAKDRIRELRECFSMVSAARRGLKFRAAFGVQVNMSCPNGEVDPKVVLEEALPILDMAEEELAPQIPLTAKFGPDLHPESAVKIAAHPRCDGLCVLNTLPFGRHPTWATETEPVDWEALFGTDDPKKSPLAKRFPGFAGSLSGAPLRPFLMEWLAKARAAGVRKHIEAGGGLLLNEDVQDAFDAGADSVSIGSAALLKPWRVKGMIRYARGVFPVGMRT
jgi:dihydroorotate dehydrogenase